MGRESDEMVKSAKIVEGIIGELRGYDEVPPPKFVWRRIANDLHTAFEQYRKGALEMAEMKMEETFKICTGSNFYECLDKVEWKETIYQDLQTYDSGNGIFVLRCKHGEPNEHYLFIKAADVDEAINRAVFDLHKPFKQMGNIGRMRGILNKVHDWLGVLIRDSCPDDRCKECLGASDRADDVYDATRSPVRNCDRFSDETEAQVAFLNEVWLISVTNLKDDPFDEWTPEMKARYAKWLLELKDAKDGGDKAEA